MSKRRAPPAPLVPGRDPREVTVVMVRHGQAGAEAGHPLGPALTRLGRLQARRVARRLATQTFTRIYTSDLNRAHETAALIAAARRGPGLIVDPRIREIQNWHVGLSPRPRQQAVLRLMRAERRKVAQFCRDLKQKSAHGDQVLVVAHGNLIRLAAAILGGTDPRRQLFFRTYNTSVTVLAFHAGGRSGHKLILVDCVRHLAPQHVTNWAGT